MAKLLKCVSFKPVRQFCQLAIRQAGVRLADIQRFTVLSRTPDGKSVIRN